MFEKKKLYVYPEAKPHIHDLNLGGTTESLIDTVPMSRAGIEKHFILTGPEDADYFYMGQFAQDSFDITKKSASNFRYFKGNEHRHICDLEGEGGFEYSSRPPIPGWLLGSKITANGIPKTYKNTQNLFTRLTFSQLLIDIARNGDEEFEIPGEISYGLRCYLNHKIRAATVHALHNSEFKKELHINRKWLGMVPLGTTSMHDKFIQTMSDNLISLCPRGSGIDSVRLYETCYYSRVPVLISDQDYYLLGEDNYDTDFCFRICTDNCDPFYIKEELGKIYNTPLGELKERALLAKKYFNEEIKRYFEDPTLYFLQWVERGNGE